MTSLTSASVSTPVASSRISRCLTPCVGGGGALGTPRTPSQQTRQSAWSVNPSQSSSVQFSIRDSPNRPSSSARPAGIGWSSRGRPPREPVPPLVTAPEVADHPPPGLGDQPAPHRRRRLAADPPQRVGFGHVPDQLLGRPAQQGVLEHLQPQRQPRPETRERLGGVRAHVAFERFPQVGEPDPPAPQLLTKAVLGQIRLAAEDPGPFHNRLVKVQVLKGVERVVVNEDGDRPLRRQEPRDVLDHRFEPNSPGLGGRRHGRRHGRPRSRTTWRLASIGIHSVRQAELSRADRGRRQYGPICRPRRRHQSEHHP